HLEQKRKLSSESCGHGWMKDFFRSRVQQLVQRYDAAAEQRARRGVRVCAHPEFGPGSPVRVFMAEQSGNEFRIAPGVMLHRGFQGENSRMTSIGANPVLTFGSIPDG